MTETHESRHPTVQWAWDRTFGRSQKLGALFAAVAATGVVVFVASLFMAKPSGDAGMATGFFLLAAGHLGFAVASARYFAVLDAARMLRTPRLRETYVVRRSLEMAGVPSADIAPLVRGEIDRLERLGRLPPA